MKQHAGLRRLWTGIPAGIGIPGDQPRSSRSVRSMQRATDDHKPTPRTPDQTIRSASAELIGDPNFPSVKIEAMMRRKLEHHRNKIPADRVRAAAETRHLARYVRDTDPSYFDEIFETEILPAVKMRRAPRFPGLGSSWCWELPKEGLTHPLRHRGGYCKIWFRLHPEDDSKWIYCHNLSAWISIGLPPCPSETKRWLVLHRCGRKRCVNPAHLYYGSESDNRKDDEDHKRFRAKRARVERERRKMGKRS